MLHTRESINLPGKCTDTCLIATIFTVLLPLLQFFHDQLLYQRYLIEAGEFWRLWTGNLVHTNHWHLALNLAGVWLLAFITPPTPYSKLTQLLQIIWIATCVGLGLWFMNPSVIWYVGLSGVLYGLFMHTGIRLLIKKDWLMAAMILLGICGKTLVDWWQGGTSASAELIEAPVIYAAHIYGMVGGLLLGIPALFQHLRKP